MIEEDNNFMPGTCIASKISCNTPFYRMEQKLEICLDTCVLVEGQYLPPYDGATLCATENASISDKYLKFNYGYKLFELVTATECVDLYLAVNN